jgi:hypothetical protein
MRLPPTAAQEPGDSGIAGAGERLSKRKREGPVVANGIAGSWATAVRSGGLFLELLGFGSCGQLVQALERTCRARLLIGSPGPLGPKPPDRVHHERRVRPRYPARECLTPGEGSANGLGGLGVTHRRGGYRDPESQAFIGSWCGKLKERLVWRSEFETLDQARKEINAYIDAYHHRPHSGLRYRTPAEVRQTWDDGQRLINTAA